MSCLTTARTASIETSELWDVCTGSDGPTAFLSGWADWEALFIGFTSFVNKFILPRSERPMVSIYCSVSKRRRAGVTLLFEGTRL